MNEETTTIEVAMDEKHTRVAVVVGTKVAAYLPHDALVISAHILDGIAGCDPNEQTPISFIGLPRVAMTAQDARDVAVAIARTADRVLVEADLEF